MMFFFCKHVSICSFPQGKNGDLSEEERLSLTLQYYTNSIGTEKAHDILNKSRHL